jgi:hypothetical protein
VSQDFGANEAARCAVARVSRTGAPRAQARGAHFAAPGGSRGGAWRGRSAELSEAQPAAAPTRPRRVASRAARLALQSVGGRCAALRGVARRRQPACRLTWLRHGTRQPHALQCVGAAPRAASQDLPKCVPRVAPRRGDARDAGRGTSSKVGQVAQVAQVAPICIFCATRKEHTQLKTAIQQTMQTLRIK